MYTLVVIDMQAEFEASADVLLSCKREIVQAMSNDAAIILVRYNCSGPIINQLTSLTRGYPNVHTVSKDNDDGSREVSEVIRKHRLSRRLRVCGVNTGYCVLETVQGLSRLPNFVCSIKVVADACSCNSGHRWGLNAMKRSRKVEIVRRRTDKEFKY